MYHYHIKSGVVWGEKSEDKNLTPTPNNSSSISQFPQSTSGICRLNFESAIASLTVQGDAIATLTNTTKPTGPSCLGGFVVSKNLFIHSTIQPLKEF
jgi:hypothetical protein